MKKQAPSPIFLGLLLLLGILAYIGINAANASANYANAYYDSHQGR